MERPLRSSKTEQRDPAIDEVKPAEPEKTYTSPDLLVIGPAGKLLRNTFSQRYREATSQYTTYWNN